MKRISMVCLLFLLIGLFVQPSEAAKTGVYLDIYNYSYSYDQGVWLFEFYPALARNDTVLVGAMIQAINDCYGKNQLQSVQPKIKQGKNGANIIYFLGYGRTYNFLIFKTTDGTVYAFTLWAEKQ